MAVINVIAPMNLHDTNAFNQPGQPVNKGQYLSPDYETYASSTTP
jgi:hypothetical protein